MSTISNLPFVTSYQPQINSPPLLDAVSQPTIKTAQKQRDGATTLRTDELKRGFAPPLSRGFSNAETHSVALSPELTMDPFGDAARQQFAGRPTLRSVVASLLRDAIGSATNRADIDVAHLAISEPDPDEPTKSKQTPLLDVALDYLVSGKTLDFTGDRVLIDTHPQRSQKANPAADSAVDIDMRSLEHLVRNVPTALAQAFKSDLVRYWNGPAYPQSEQDGPPPLSRRQWLSDMLRDNLRLIGFKHPQLDDVQRETLDQVVRHPQKSMRLHADGDNAASVFTLYTGLKHDPDSWSAYRDDLLIVRKVSGREVVLLYTPDGKIQSFDSVADFKKNWGQQLQAQLPLDQLNSDLVEPDGSIFDAQADNILQQNLRDITLLPTTQAHTTDLAEQFRQSSDPTLGLGTATTADPNTIEQLKKEPPDWLRNASDRDRLAYRNWGQELISSLYRHQGHSYKHGIPDITLFAQRQLDAKLPKGYASKDINVVFKVPVGTLGSGYITRVPMSLSAMALANIAGLPSNEIEVYNHGRRVAELERSGVLKNLVQEVNIGKTYPDLLKRTLLGDSPDTQKRRALFAEQSAIELPLQALRLALQKDAGFSRRGYHFIEAIVKPSREEKTAEGQEVVIRPLAFLREPHSQPDVVDNMFLIEPKDTAAGPHILYRPLISEAPLLEFPTRAALMEAIAKPGNLQNSVLAWLPDKHVRDVYDHNGFREPHIHHFYAGDEFPVYEAAHPATLAIDGYSEANTLLHGLRDGKLMDLLYDANARSLASLAEQQSVSNSESRWASLKEGGFLLLNAVLPALRTPGMVLGAVMQLGSIQNDLQALDSSDPEGKPGAVADLLLNLMFAISHLTSSSYVRARGNELPRDTVAVDKYVTPSEHLGSTLPDDINRALMFPEQYPRTQWVELINSFEVAQPSSPPPAINEGRLKGLYRIDSKLYAKANEKWYRVGADLDQVFLIDGANKSRTGPFLQRSLDDHWEFKKIGGLKGGESTAAEDKEILARYEEAQAPIALQDKKLEISRTLLDTVLKTYKENRAQLFESWRAIDTPAADSDAQARYQEQLALTTASRTQLDKVLDAYNANLNISHELRRSAIEVLTPKSSTEKSSMFQSLRSEIYLKMFNDYSALKNVYETFAGDGEHSANGEPLRSIAQKQAPGQGALYQKLIDTLQNKIEQKERLRQYVGNQSHLLDEWKTNSPIGKEHANHMHNRLTAERALATRKGELIAKTHAANDNFRIAKSAYESDPSNNQLLANKNQAEQHLLKLYAESRIEDLNAKLIINRSNANIYKGKKQVLIHLSEEKHRLATQSVKASLALDLHKAKEELFDIQSALQNDPANTSLNDKFRRINKNIAEIQRRLSTPAELDSLAKERQYSRTDLGKIPVSDVNLALIMEPGTFGSIKELSLNKTPAAPPSLQEGEIGRRIAQTSLTASLRLHENLLAENDLPIEERKSGLTQLVNTYESLLRDSRQLQNMDSVIIRPRYNALLIDYVSELLKNVKDQQDVLNQAEHDNALPSASTSSQPNPRQSAPKPKKPRGPTSTPTQIQVSDAENLPADAPAPEVKPAVPVQSVNTLKAQATKLVDQWQQQERLVLHQKKKLSQPQELPKLQPLEWDEMLGRPAEQLLELARETEVTHGADPAYALLIEQWRAQAHTLQKTMHEHVRDAYVLQPPTAANVIYLVTQGLATIEPNPRVFPTLAGDVFTEYAVRDTRAPCQILWYAHFHYATSEAASAHPDSFQAAHLKLPSQQKLTQRDLNRIAGNKKTADAIVRARITHPLSQVFLKTSA